MSDTQISGTIFTDLLSTNEMQNQTQLTTIPMNMESRDKSDNQSEPPTEAQSKQDEKIFECYVESLRQQKHSKPEVEIRVTATELYCSNPMEFRKRYGPLIRKQGTKSCPQCGYLNHHRVLICKGCEVELNHGNFTSSECELQSSGMNTYKQSRGAWIQKCRLCGKPRKGHICTYKVNEITYSKDSHNKKQRTDSFSDDEEIARVRMELLHARNQVKDLELQLTALVASKKKDSMKV